MRDRGAGAIFPLRWLAVMGALNCVSNRLAPCGRVRNFPRALSSPLAVLLRVAFLQAVCSFVPMAHAAQTCMVANPIATVTPPTNVRQMIYSPTYGRLVVRNTWSAIATIDLATAQSTLHSSNSTFTDMAISPSGRYVFGADYGGENIGYGSPANISNVHRLDLTNNTWESRTAYIAGGIQVVSDEQFILRSIDQWITFTNNAWGTGAAAVPLNAATWSSGPGYYAWVSSGDFRYDVNTGRLLHGNSGSSSQEIQAFKLVGNEFVAQEGSGTYGSASGYGGNVALATDGSAFYYGRLQVDPLDVSFNRRVFAEPIYAATGTTAFGNGKFFDANTGNLIGNLGFDTTVYALNPSGDDFWAFDASQNQLRHFNFASTACGTLPAPIGVSATLTQGTKNFVVSWTGIAGATGYNIYMAKQTGVTKANYASLSGGQSRPNVTSPHTEFASPPGNYYLVVTAFNDSGESMESAQVSVAVPDTQAPTVPVGLTATVVDSSRINLSWNASTDDVGVYYYQMFRGGNHINNVYAPLLSYTDSGLSALTQYSYSVLACDTSYNCSPQSTPVSVATPVRTTPDPFTFFGQAGVLRGIVVISNNITVTGIGGPAAISIIGGEYSIAGGAFTANAGMVTNNQGVVVRLTSSANYGTATTATLTVGGVSSSFNVTTLLQTIIATQYLPLAPGNSWVMRRSGVEGTATITGTQVVNGAPTTGLSDALDGSIAYFTNDASGVRQHRTYFPPGFIAGCGTVAETDTYSPPVTIIPASFTVGQMVYSNGTVTVDYGACGSFSLSYGADSTFQAFERVTVPAGQFDALKVRVRLSITGTSSSSVTYNTYWFAAGIGKVKEIDSYGTVRELVSTSIASTTADEIRFAAQSNMAINTLAISNPVTITGITTATAVSITSGEYSIDGGTFTGVTGSVTNGQVVRVRVTSSALPFTSTSATLTVGTVTGTFTVTTGSGPLSAVKSRKPHGVTDHDILINHDLAIGDAISIEPRMIGAGHRIVFQFSGAVSNPGMVGAVDAASVPIDDATATINPLASNEVIVMLTAIPDNKRVKIALTGVNVTGVNGTTNVAAPVGFLVGDVNNNRAVNAGDVSGVKAHIGLTTTALNFKFDVNADGVVNAADTSAVKARSGLMLP